jgi:hypothetical protein
VRDSRLWIALTIVVVTACSSGGEYVKGGRTGGDVDRGETNGRMFDFVSNMPEGDDWQIRIRDNSLWCAYGDGERVKDLGTAAISSKDAEKIWELVDAVEIPERKKGRPDEDEGFVELRLREPGGEELHDLFKIFVSRADAEDDEEVLALAGQLQKLVEKYFKKKPEF